MAVPTDFRRLSYWFKADALGLSDGASVTQLTDYSGNGRHITQATSGNQATAQTVSGTKVVRFDGTDDFYSLANYNVSKRSRVTIYAVFRMAANTVPTASHTIIEHSANASTTTGGWGTCVDIYNRFNGIIKNSVSGTYTKRSRSRIGTDFVSTTTFFDLYQCREQVWTHVNGREEWSRTGANSTSPVHGYTGNWGGTMRNDTLYVGMRGGTTLPFAGDLAELIIYEEMPTPTQRFDIEDYLATKYSISDRVLRSDIQGIYLHDGDSMNEGAPAAPPASWCDYILRNSKQRWIWHNIANQGRTVYQEAEDGVIEQQPWNDHNFATRVSTFGAATNDLHYMISGDGSSANSRDIAYANHAAFANQMAADGWKVIEATMFSRGDFVNGTPADFDTQAGIYNTAVRADYASRGSALFDIGIGSGETRLSDFSNKTYFTTSDDIHQSDIGYRVQAELSKTAYESVGFDLLPFGTMGTAENQTPLKHWFSAEQVRTFPVGVNAPQVLEDQSGYNLLTPRSWNHGTTANRPTVLHSALNGLPALRFNGTTHSLQMTGAFDLSVPSSLVLFIVIAAITTTDAGIILELAANSDSATDAFKIEHLANDHIKATMVGNVGTSDFETTATFNGPGLLTVILDKGASTNEASVLINGAAASGTRTNNSNNTNTFASAQGLTMASRNTTSQFLAMDFCELVIYGPTLGTSDRQEWEQFLCTKYGLTWAG